MDPRVPLETFPDNPEDVSLSELTRPLSALCQTRTAQYSSVLEARPQDGWGALKQRMQKLWRKARA